ncbi:BRO family protein [Phytobacter ursingii]|uniref:BRO-N domain-containing protein n=1 Tax=Phytobacter ursingii TaxID=1972431 RepID=UPI0031B741A8
MANSQTAVFNFDSDNQVRSIVINDAPWFVAQDVCTALRIQNVTQALEKLDGDERSMLNIGHEHRSIFDSRVKEVNVISESGLYTLILRCRDAVTPGTIPYRFRKWVTSEVLPQIRQTGSYSREPVQEQLPAVATTMSVRDARRGKKETDKKAAARIAEKCVPVIMREMRDYQYHYSNCEVGPAEVLPALLSDDRQGLQLQALLRELGENNHEVSGAFRELEVIRYCLIEQRKIIRDIGTHAQYIMAHTAGR